MYIATRLTFDFRDERVSFLAISWGWAGLDFHHAYRTVCTMKSHKNDSNKSTFFYCKKNLSFCLSLTLEFVVEKASLSFMRKFFRVAFFPDSRKVNESWDSESWQRAINKIHNCLCFAACMNHELNYPEKISIICRQGIWVLFATIKLLTIDFSAAEQSSSSATREHLKNSRNNHSILHFW